MLQACAEADVLSVCRELVERIRADVDSPSPWDSRTPRQIGEGSSDREMRRFFGAVGAFLGRYKFDSGPPVHISATSTVKFAVDMDAQEARVAVELVVHAEQLANELRARQNAALSPD